MKALKAIGKVVLWTMAAVGALFVGLVVLAVTLSLSNDEGPDAAGEVAEKSSPVEKVEAKPKPTEPPKRKPRQFSRWRRRSAKPRLASIGMSSNMTCGIETASGLGSRGCLQTIMLGLSAAAPKPLWETTTI